MSRSYKHVPYRGDRKSDKAWANRKVRNLLKRGADVPGRGGYRKAYEQYDICDFSDICSWKEYWRAQTARWLSWGHAFYPCPDEKECLQEWKKAYLRK